MTRISIRILKAGIDVSIHHDSETVPGFLGEVERLGGVPGDLLVSCGLEEGLNMAPISLVLVLLLSLSIGNRTGRDWIITRHGAVGVEILQVVKAV